MGARKTVLLSLLTVAVIGEAAMGQDAPAVRLRLGTNASQRRARVQWFRSGRDEGGVAALRFRAYQQKLALRNALGKMTPSPRDISAGVWQSLGPAPLASDASGIGQQDYGWVSGRATAVALDPADASGNTVFVGGAYGGLWKSVNAGSASSDPSNVIWQPLIDDQPSLAVGAIAIQPGNADPNQSVVLVGTGETNSSADSYYGLGILRSQDGGVTWSPMIQADKTNKHSLLGLGFSQMAFSTANTSLVVAATAGTPEGEIEGRTTSATANLGLYSSTDGGASWTYGTARDGVSVVSPASATAVVYNAAAQEFFAVLRFHGFYTSTDGVNWTRLANQPGSGLAVAACPASPASQACPIYRGEIAIVPNRAGSNNLGEMYVWYVDAGNNDQGIWRSVDAGATWQPLDETGIRQCGDLVGGCGSEDGSYNLTLAAVLNGATGTDLYAGAINLFKCTITNSFPSCSPAGTPLPPPTATFRNLTHVYGCNPLGSIAHVHPGQHAIDFLPVNGGQQVVMYFANDGGIYRALDGYTGLTSGTCGTPNQFDDLNATLGSMSQFVSLTLDPTDANTLLGGAQGNGSPATGDSLASTIWSEVNSADGGNSVINPANPDEWFTANTGVSIQACELGINCRAGDFNVMVSSGTLGGDEGPWYVPYLLDPKSASTMIAGTCRLWRGTTSGSGFTAISNNFETGSDAICTGSEINTVRSLAVGGKANAGLSNTMYAGTNGTGPLAPAPGGGRLWVTTNAAGGVGTWVDRTGNINPKHYPISAIALDPSDASGSTAYVAIMGFGVAHVWKTANAGRSWVNFTATLPNAPVNALLVDSGTVYAGTDVGVFATGTGGAAWAEVGPVPTPGAGQTGFLPDAPVMALAMFNNGITKLLRAGTYGRGVWQFALTTAPDFQIALPAPTQTAFAGDSAEFAGVIDVFNGYDNAITLNCAAGGTAAPETCGVSPTSLMPDLGSARFSVTAGSGRVGDYAFQVVGTGTDGLVRSGGGMTLHVVDFSLSSPIPSTLTLQPGQSSDSVALQVQFLGNFPPDTTVTLTCSPLAGVNCSFSPSPEVQSDGGNPSTVMLTIGTLASTQQGDYNVTVSATASFGTAKTVSQPLGLTILTPDYAISASTPPLTQAETAVAVNGTLTTANGYGYSVEFSCVAGTTAPPSTCSFIPSSVVPSATGTPFTLNLASLTAGFFSFNLQGVGADRTTVQTANPVALTVYDFAIVPDGNTQSISAGQSAVYKLNIAPEPNGVNFPQAVGGFQCSGLPALSSCAFSPTQVPAGSGVTTVQLTVSTTGPIAEDGRSRLFKVKWLAYTAWMPMVGMLIIPSERRRRKRAGAVVSVVATLMLILPYAACGGGLQGNNQGGGGGGSAHPGTPAGTYTIEVTASQGTLQRSATPPLTLAVQ